MPLFDQNDDSSLEGLMVKNLILAISIYSAFIVEGLEAGLHLLTSNSEHLDLQFARSKLSLMTDEQRFNAQKDLANQTSSLSLDISKIVQRNLQERSWLQLAVGTLSSIIDYPARLNQLALSEDDERPFPPTTVSAALDPSCLYLSLGNTKAKFREQG